MVDGRVKNGGKREGAGRKSTKHEYIDDGEITPLMFMLDIMRDEAAPKQARYQAARDCAPYCHAKLVSKHLEFEGDVNIELISYLDEN